MQFIKKYISFGFLAIALAIVVAPTATFASYGDDYGYYMGDVGGYDYSSGSSYDNYSPSYGYSSGGSYNNSTPSYDYSSGSSYDNYVPSYNYSSGSSYDNYVPSYNYSSGSSYDNYVPSYNYSSGSSYDNYVPSYTYSTPSYSTGCSTCGTGSTGGSYYTPSYTTGYTGGCNGGSCNTSTSNHCTGSSCNTGSTPSYNYVPSYSTSYSNASAPSANTNGNTNSNYIAPRFTYSTGPVSGTNTNNSSTSISSTNTNNNNSNAVNNSTTTVSVNNNIVVNIPFLPGYGGNNNNHNNNDNQLNGSCSVNPSYNVQVGQDVNFYASATGGNGTYSYSWNGSDGLNSSGQSFTGRFYTPGSKYANVTITSGNQSVTRSCNVNVDGNYNSNLTVSCTANPSVGNINQSINWVANATGGNGNYYYSWTGTDGLSGSGPTISRSYNQTGQKYATVTVTSNGQSYTATCYSTINAIYGYQSQASNVTLIKGTSDTVNPVSGIFLNQIPATGISMNGKIALFTIGLILWSAFAAVIISRKNKNKLAIAGSVTADRIAEFKGMNLLNK